jgi:galactitol-specific phosphotransferase system IIB component
MKKIIFLTVVLIISLSCASKKTRSISAFTPTQDQYWNDLVDESREAHARITDVLEENYPSLYNEILLDSKDPMLPMFWGQSTNFDSGAKKQIVDTEIIQVIQAMFNIKNDNKIVHAGIMHTYGYLFSTINTSYGYKRKRWISPTLNIGFGLNGNSLSPETIEGGLLSNVTYFTGMIALSDKIKLGLLKNVSNEVVTYDYSKLNVDRLEEATKDYTIVTSLVKLPNKVENDANEYLLIYSIIDHRIQKETLVTAFPINTDSYKNILAPGALGPNQKIILRYNAYLAGAEKSAIGTRKLVKKK